MSILRRFRFGLVLAMAAMAGVVVAGVRVKLEDVPAPAVKTVKEKFPKAEIRYVDKESANRYEFAMKEGDRQFDVGVLADGKLVNVKEEIAEDKLPAPVKEAVQKKFPGGKIVESEKVIDGDGKDAKTVYELKVKLEKGSQEVKFDPSGKPVEDKD